MPTSKCLVIGSGSIGERHAKNLAKIFNKKVYVLSRNNKKNFRDHYLNQSDKVIKISKEDLKKFENLDLAILATPSSIRAEILEPLEHIKIKCIYAEVPAAKSFTSWTKLKNLSLKLNCKLYAGYNMRFHPGIKKLKSLSNSNKFLSLRGIFGEFLPDLHKWENFKFRYEAIKILGGGPLLTSHHEIDIAIYLMGRVKKVSCIMRKTFLDIDADDHVILNLIHENNSISNLDLNFFYKKYVRRLEISTEKEIIRYEPFNDGLSIGEMNMNNFKDYDFNQTYIDSLKEILSNNFYLSPTIEDIDHLMRVSDACLKSSKNDGKIIKV